MTPTPLRRRSALRAPHYPGLAAFIEQNVLAVPSDAEALAVFSGWAKADDEGEPRAE